MKILLVANGYPPTAYGGVEVYSQGIANSMHAAGHSVRVFCRESDPGHPDGTIMHDEVDGITVTRVVNDFKSISTFEQTFLDAGLREIFLEKLGEFSPDLVHFNHWIALSADLPLGAVELGVPSVATLHDFWPLCQRVHLLDWRGRRCPGPTQGGDCYRCVVGSAKPRALLLQFLRWGKRSTLSGFGGRVRRLVRSDALSVVALTGTRADFDARYRTFRESLGLVDRVLTPSDYVRKVFQANGYDTSRFTVLPLGIEPMESVGRSSQPHDPIRLAFIGSVLPAKGLHVLLEALAKVSGDHLMLDVYGRMDADPAYTRKVRKLAGRDDRVHLRGPFTVEAKSAVYAEIDVLVVPSIVPESFSLVAREALLSGIPVIASNVGALPEIITDGVNGFLFEPGEAVGLAALLARLAAEPGFINQLDLPGPTPILSREEHVQRLLTIYRDVL